MAFVEEISRAADTEIERNDKGKIHRARAINWREMKRMEIEEKMSTTRTVRLRT